MPMSYTLPVTTFVISRVKRPEWDFRQKISVRFFTCETACAAGEATIFVRYRHSPMWLHSWRPGPTSGVVFAVPAYQRYCERIPKELLTYLVPDLGDVPLEIPWHPQTVSGLLFEHLEVISNRSLPIRAARKLQRIVTGRQHKSLFTNTKAKERSDLLDAGLEDFRSLCFDQTESPLWALIDRSRLEHLLSSQTPAQQRRRQHDMLYDIFTLFQYSSADFLPVTKQACMNHI